MRKIRLLADTNSLKQQFVYAWLLLHASIVLFATIFAILVTFDIRESEGSIVIATLVVGVFCIISLATILISRKKGRFQILSRPKLAHTTLTDKRRGDLQELDISYIEEHQEKRYNNPEFWFRLGLAMIAEGKVAKAQEYFNNYLRYNPDSRETQIALEVLQSTLSSES